MSKTLVEYLEVERESVEQYLELLKEVDLNLYDYEIPEDSTLYEVTQSFEDGNVARVKICSGTENLFVDVILEDSNCNELCILDPEDDIRGEFFFEYNDTTYILVVGLDKDTLSEDLIKKYSENIKGKINKKITEIRHEACYDNFGNMVEETCMFAQYLLTVAIRELFDAENNIITGVIMFEGSWYAEVSLDRLNILQYVKIANA